jgi:excisionase family DNA binding protein
MISDIQPRDRFESLLTFKEAMGYLRVSRSTLYRFMEAGQLTGYKVGCSWRFYREDLQACIGLGTSASSVTQETGQSRF